MRELTSQIIAALLILLFAYSAIDKYIDHNHFSYTLQQSSLVQPIASLVSWLIPIAEFGTVSLLLFPTLRKTGFICSIILLSVFTLYIIYMELFVPNLPCSCGGVIRFLSWKQHLLLNICFLALALYGWYDRGSNKNIAIRRSQTPVT